MPDLPENAVLEPRPRYTLLATAGRSGRKINNNIIVTKNRKSFPRFFILKIGRITPRPKPQLEKFCPAINKITKKY